MGSRLARARLLDVGAGPGFFARGAMDAGCQVEAIEASPPAIEIGAREFGIKFLDLESAEDCAYDMVTCFHVLEHLEEPTSLLSTLRNKLRPGGALMVHVPNHESLSEAALYQARRVLQGRDTRRGSLYFPEHLTAFTERGLSACAVRAGFTPLKTIQIGPFNSQYDPLLLANYFFGASGRLKRPEVLALGRLLFKGVLDTIGKPFGRGSWIAALFDIPSPIAGK
jgi:SAM-dependent methyltransferase